MKINLAKSSGFCFGVKRALNIALETAKSNEKVFMLGDIVHNEDVVRQVQEAGIEKIKQLTSGKGKILLIRAHGSGIKTFKRSKMSGYKIIDATCPMVKEIHKIAKSFERRGYRIIIIGDKKHDEVQGIIGQLKRKAIVIDNIKRVPFKLISKLKKACILSQSTQNIDQVARIVKVLRPYCRQVRFFNTICMPTRIKQEEIKRMSEGNDVMIVIGSKSSANTKRLYEISKSINKQTYWIESRRDIKLNWFENAQNVGIAAGASTPDSTTQEVVTYLKQIHHK